MSLPKLTVPTFKLKIPSTGKEIKYRPFLSKEEKILMLVKQSDNSEMVMESMRDIINVCTFNTIDVDSLSIFDIEYIFLQLRAKSIGEIIDIDMKCNNKIDLPLPEGQNEWKEEDISKKLCGATIPFSINIDDIVVTTPTDHTNIIMLENDIGVTMRYPSINDVKMIEENADNDVNIIKELIVNIFDTDNVYEISDTSPEEFDEFVGTINAKQTEDIRKKFFYNMPTLEYVAKYTCPNCGSKGEYTFRGIHDFF